MKIKINVPAETPIKWRSPMKKSIITLFLFFVISFGLIAGCATTTLKFTGAVEPITSPILLQYAPYTATQVTEGSFTASGALSITLTTRTTCEVQIIKQVRGLQYINSCTEYTDGKSSEYQFSANISPLGKYSNVEFKDDGKQSNDEQKMQLMVKQIIENNESLVIRNPIVSGASIFEIRVSDFFANILKMFNINSTSDATLRDVVKGWGIYEGKRVLVTDLNFDGSFSIQDKGTVRISMSGYKIIDANTMAILSSKGAGTIDFTVKGETGRIEMNITSAASLK